MIGYQGLPKHLKAHEDSRRVFIPPTDTEGESHFAFANEPDISEGAVLSGSYQNPQVFNRASTVDSLLDLKDSWKDEVSLAVQALQAEKVQLEEELNDVTRQLNRLLEAQARR